jgi:manganese/zinc/iron transport system permease protein
MDSFWIILTGSLVAASCGLLGTYLVIRKMSLLGDAISHAILPGIALAFLISQSRAILPMFIGALIFGIITVYLVELFYRKWAVQEDASIGIVFTALFAIGVVIISTFTGNVDIDQECVLYGEIAYTPWDLLLIDDVSLGPRPVWILGFVFLLNIIFISIFYKELKIVSFDSAMAVSLGFNVTLIHYLLMGAVSVTTVAAFESVGAILVVAMLIVPGASALLWSHRLSRVLVLSVLFGILSSFLGYWLASFLNSSIAGSITVVMGIIFLISFIFAPEQGLFSKLFHRWNLSLKMSEDHILLHMTRAKDKNQQYTFTRSVLIKAGSTARFVSAITLYNLIRKKYISYTNEVYSPTRKGYDVGMELLQKHRLWEAYLSNLGMPEDHLHAPADDLEHFIDDDLKKELQSQVDDVGHRK